MSVPACNKAVNSVSLPELTGAVPATVLIWSDPRSELMTFGLPVSTPAITALAISR